MDSASLRPTIRLASDCNNDCIFCAPHGLARLPSIDVASCEAELQHHLHALRDITFVGGEPTLVPHLDRLIAVAREVGYTAIGIQTNGRRLARESYTSELVASGLTDILVSVLGPDSAAHDYHTGVAGSFEESFGGIAAARNRGVTVVVTTVLTRSNFRSLSSLPAVLKTRGAAAWNIAMPHVAGRVRSAFDRLIPRMALAVPYALHALEAADRVGLAAFVQGIPICLLGPFAPRSLPETARSFGDSCDGCRARALCCGIDPAYLARFRADELSPTKVHSVSTRALPEVARLFVGVGELALEPPTDGAPDRAARSHLPVYAVSNR